MRVETVTSEKGAHRCPMCQYHQAGIGKLTHHNRWQVAGLEATKPVEGRWSWGPLNVHCVRFRCMCPGS